MNQLKLFLPCAAGVEDSLATEVQRITGEPLAFKARGGVGVMASWRDAMRLNLHSRLSQRVLVQLWHGGYRSEQDLYNAAGDIAWEIWFTPAQTIKVEVTAQHSPLTSLNFAALKIKDAICDRFRAKRGERPSVNTTWPDVRIYAHLTTEELTLYIDTSGEPLFKRGWREDKGDAPLKETLAAAMIAATGWNGGEAESLDAITPLYDPCCGSGTVVIEAAQIALHIAPGLLRRFAFEKMVPFQPHVWSAIQDEAERDIRDWPEGHPPIVFGSDVSFRMVDFAQRNAERAGVAHAMELRGGDALQRLPPTPKPGVMLLNPPYGERIAAAGVAGQSSEDRASARAQRMEPRAPRTFTVAGKAAPPATGLGRADSEVSRLGRESAQMADGGDGSEFFQQLAAHWKTHYAGWSAWLLTPDLKLPGKMRFKESRRVPMWNGPIECRLFRFDLIARRAPDATPPAA
ncbi:MAG: THUMP domain-containing protein [Hydrogenophaga sp.]|jgi:putative N6-adenine-specific DNA methylase|uniref:THUMP domain-containing class I SAM-dependent RNA methyltransferase n=1 Tax=Hydrogenophaga sp. TaxID=1904254 RepID=UPI002735D22C|nr:THUMP domain-containing protein [Hydrogenophaga sp.]MDP1893156.1 THUMP domain-containing protein [Hydrogenophaga sp.]MDP2219522.1 THUMP domain-containing protein [Hydrogenophaga sp.]MDP3374459.1 THUMP domain-containing protein [Hydrogenophaga sp.]MDP3805260.1 THUMP domain-containing protein [Hydrogenophaga sp.]MDP3922314.1 THUMP domain-containing protein [Hydrogenophaga sp.]